MNEQEIKDNVRATRKRLGLTQEEMGEGLGLNRNAYRAFESGDTHIISPHAYKLARIAGVSVESLLLGYEPSRSSDAALKEADRLHELLLAQREDYERQLSQKDEIIAGKDALILAKNRTIKVQEELIAMLRQK